MDNNYIVVEGRSIRYERRRIDVGEVQYYLDNPRINYIISRQPQEQITPTLIEKALLGLDSTKDLVLDIEKNGGLLDPIIVYNGCVIEGNTRLCAYRKLRKKHPNDERWSHIDANVIIDDISTREIFAILGNYHIKGKTSWDAYEKAACIKKMIEQGQSIDDVARIIGSKRPKVENLLKAYEAMRLHYLPKVTQTDQMAADQDELRKYSYFDVLYTDKELSKRVESTAGFLDQFVEWVAEDRLPKAQDVRELNDILSNKRARRVFEEEEPESAFMEAKYVLYKNSPEKAIRFYQQVDKFRKLIAQADVVKIKEEMATNPRMKLAVEHCFRDFKKFCKTIGLE